MKKYETPYLEKLEADSAGQFCLNGADTSNQIQTPETPGEGDMDSWE